MRFPVMDWEILNTGNSNSQITADSLILSSWNAVNLTEPSWISSKILQSKWKVSIRWDGFQPIFLSRGLLWLILCEFLGLILVGRFLHVFRVAILGSKRCASIFWLSCLLLKWRSWGTPVFLLRIRSRPLGELKEMWLNTRGLQNLSLPSYFSWAQGWPPTHHFLLRTICSQKQLKPTRHDWLSLREDRDRQLRPRNLIWTEI